MSYENLFTIRGEETLSGKGGEALFLVDCYVGGCYEELDALHGK